MPVVSPGWSNPIRLHGLCCKLGMILQVLEAQLRSAAQHAQGVSQQLDGVRRQLAQQSQHVPQVPLHPFCGNILKPCYVCLAPVLGSFQSLSQTTCGFLGILSMLLGWLPMSRNGRQVAATFLKQPNWCTTQVWNVSLILSAGWLIDLDVEDQALRSCPAPVPSQLHWPVGKLRKAGCSVALLTGCCRYICISASRRMLKL